MQDEWKPKPTTASYAVYDIQRILSSIRYSVVFRIQKPENDHIAAHSIQNIQCWKRLTGQSWRAAIISGSTIIAVPAAVYRAVNTRLARLCGMRSMRFFEKKI